MTPGLPPPKPAIIQLLQVLSGHKDARLRYLTPKQQSDMNVPNALVDAVPVKGHPNKLRASRIMYMPQGTYQALDSLVHDTGVKWPEETQAIALMTLLHEAGHLRGGKKWQGERRQQGFALGHYLSGAKRLGIDPEKAARMLKMAQDYTLTLPKDYRPRNLP